MRQAKKVQTDYENLQRMSLAENLVQPGQGMRTPLTGRRIPNTSLIQRNIDTN